MKRLNTYITDRDEMSAVLMFTLSTIRQPDDHDIEVAFRIGLTDLLGESPDFVVSMQQIEAAVPEAILEIADEPLGMALRLMADNLSSAIDLIVEHVRERCELNYGTVSFGRVLPV